MLTANLQVKPNAFKRPPAPQNPRRTASFLVGLQQRSAWPAGVLTGLVLLAVALVAAVIAVNPGIFKREFKSQFLLVRLTLAFATLVRISTYDLLHLCASASQHASSEDACQEHTQVRLQITVCAKEQQAQVLW